MVVYLPRTADTLKKMLFHFKHVRQLIAGLQGVILLLEFKIYNFYGYVFFLKSINKRK